MFRDYDLDKAYRLGKYLYGGFLGSNRLHLSASPGTRENLFNDLTSINVGRKYLCESRKSDNLIARDSTYFIHYQFSYLFMSFMEFITSLGEGYTTVDLGSSSSPPGELANPEILPELDFQKPINGTPVIQSLSTLPYPSSIQQSDSVPVSVQTESEFSAIKAIAPLSHSMTDTFVIHAPETQRSHRNLETVCTILVETLRRKPPLMIQRVGRLSLQGFSSDVMVAPGRPSSNRDNFAFDSTDKTELVGQLSSLPTKRPTSLISSSPIVIEILDSEPTRIVHEDASVQTIVRLNPSSISISPKIIVDSSSTPFQKIIQGFETTTPIELDAESTEAVDVVAEILPGVDEFALDTTDPVCIDEPSAEKEAEENDSLRLDDPVSSHEDTNEGSIVAEREYEEPEDVEYVEAQLLSESAGTTVTPSEADPAEHVKPTAFGTFAAITALVKLQRRVRRRYDQQRSDLINSLGL